MTQPHDTPPPTTDLPPATAPGPDPHATIDHQPAPDAAAPAPGVVPGYEVLGELGRGGMGVVYRARQVKANRIVALKMIRGAGHAAADELARFRTEAEAIARLQHPNIVQVYDVGEHEGTPYFSLEFCSGGSLDRKLAGTPLPPAEAAKLVETLARAMAAAHGKDVLHRDLKPANVLLAEDGTPKITDFGLAKKLDEVGQTQEGAVMGTPSYMAPEQAGGKGEDLGPACDVYALGALLYECLTGRPPFKAATPLDTILQVVREEPVPPSQLQSKTPRDLETICLKCLQKEPPRRYASAVELAEELRRFQEGRPILARPAGRLERGWRWCKRNPALAVAWAAVLLVFAAGTTVSGVLAVLADRRADEAVAARNDLENSNDRLLTSVARNLLRPLALQPQPNQPLPPLSNPEIEALWDLASSPEDRLRLRFVADALRDPAPTRQLKDRAEVALHAAVGLDAGRRARVEQLLAEHLDARETTPDQQREIALILAHFGVHERVVAGRSGRRLSQAMTRTTDPPALRELAEGLSAVAARMEPKEAAAVTGQAAATLAHAMTKTTDREALRELAKGLSAVAGRMEAKEAAATLSQAMTKTTDFAGLSSLGHGLRAVAARMEAKEGAATLAHAMSTTTDPLALSPLAEGLSAVGSRLEAKDAAAIAATLSQAMAKTTTPDALGSLARGLSAVAARMEATEAAAVAGHAAATLAPALTKTTDQSALLSLAQGLRELAGHLEAKDAAATAATLSQAMTKTTVTDALRSLAWALSAVAGRLEAKDAAATAATFSQVMTEMTDGGTLRELAWALSAVAGRLEAKEVAAVVGQAAATLAHAMSKMADPYHLPALAEGLSAVAGHLEAKEAAAVAGQAAATLAHAMSKTTDPIALSSQAGGLSVVAAHMEAKKAAAVAGQAAATLVRAMSKTTDPFKLLALADGLSAVAGRLEVKEAAATAAALAQAMTKTTAPIALSALANGLSAVAGRLEAKDAAAIAATLSQALAKTTAPDALGSLARGLSAVAARMEATEAAATAATFSATAATLARAMSKTTDPIALSSLAGGLSAVAARLEAKEAAATAATLAQVISKTNNLHYVPVLAQGLSAVLVREPYATFVRRHATVASTVTALAGQGTLLTAPALLNPAPEPLPPPLPAQLLVDLLKQPLFVGETRLLVLTQLSRHYGRPFADQWEFVDYVHQHNLPLDLTTPPQSSAFEMGSAKR